MEQRWNILKVRREKDSGLIIQTRRNPAVITTAAAAAVAAVIASKVQG